MEGGQLYGYGRWPTNGYGRWPIIRIMKVGRIMNVGNYTDNEGGHLYG